jgi:hypothetical protein
MAPPFEEVDMSDTDSISLTSTQASDAEAEYAVEKILAEELHHETDEVLYLVKWEGYPLHASTWEPAENLLADQILSDWKRDKDAVKAGISEPFDMELYLEIMERYTDEKEERKERRAAKRRRLGLPSRNGSVTDRSADDAEARNAAESSEDDEPARGRRKQDQDPTPKRKGVAQKIKTSLNRQVTTIISSDESGAGIEGEYSPREKRRTKPAAKTPAGQSVSGRRASSAVTKPVASGARGNTTTAASVTPATKVTQKRPSVQFTASAKKPVAARPVPSTASSGSFAKRTQPSSSARKSAPSTASAFGNNATVPRKLPVLPYDPPKRKAPADPFTGFGKPAPERKGRKLSASNPKIQRFSNLAEENRVRKFSAKEAAPDPSVLATFNPATGTWDEPAMKHRAAVLSSASAANNVFGRREAPTPVRQRSVSPPPATTGARTVMTMPGDNTTTYTKVCWYWRDSTCQNKHCTYAHHYITCPDWRRDNCPKKDSDCSFDHREDGRDPIFRTTLDAWNTGVHFPGHNPNAVPVVQPPQKLARPPPVLPPPSTGKQPIIFVKPNEIPCRYWARGDCFKPASECKFLHRETGAPSDPQHITCGYWAQSQCKSKKCMFAHHETAYSTLGPREESSITCSFWVAGQCHKFRCEFAHHETGCRSLGPPPLPQLAPADLREMSPGAVVDDGPSAASTIAAQTGPTQTGPTQTGAAQTGAAQTSPAKIGVAPTANMTPASRRPSLPVAQVTDQPAFINDVALEVRFGDFDFKAATQLACATRIEAAALNDAIGWNPQLFMEHTMHDKLLQNQVAEFLKHGGKLTTGDIICKDPRRDHAKKLAAGLHASSLCGVVQSSTYTLIVHSIGTGEWAVLTQEGDAQSSQAPLKFILLPGLPFETPTSKDLASKNTTKDTTGAPAKDWLTSADVERMLKTSDIRTEDKVFIMMPPSKADEMLRMAKVFKDRFKQSDYAGRTPNVWTSLDKGIWDSLAEKAQRRGGGLLIVDWEIPLWDIPHLAGVLHHSSFRVFSVGVDPHLAGMEGRPPKFGCQRLFYMGDVVFVTDEVFIETPEKVLRIIDEINKQNKLKPAGASRHKIAARPGIRTWLMRLVTEQPEGTEDPRLLKLLEAVWDLCPDDKQDMFNPGNPSKDADMVSEPAELMPTHQALFETEPAKATDFAVNWFAGWAFMNAANYRRFTVCHAESGTGKPGLDENYNKVTVDAESDPRGWAKEYSYVMFMTPDEWLKEKLKPKK